MFRLITCIAYEHSPALLALAAFVCTFGSVVTAQLLACAIGSSSSLKYAWTFLGAVAAGSTIWCTHFIAMLAYDPGVAISYEPILTLVSLIVAICGCGSAFLLASIEGKYPPIAAGCVFGLAVSALHYTGVSAFSLNGFVAWDITYVTVSLFAGMLFGMPAFVFGTTPDVPHGRLKSAACIMLSIVAMHFIGMSAMTITPIAAADNSSMIDPTARNVIIFAATGVGLMIFGTGAVSFFLDQQAREHAAARVRHMTRSAVDGMAVTQDGAIVEANPALERMTGLSRDQLIGRSIKLLLGEVDSLPEGELVRVSLRTGDGSEVPVELALLTESSTLDARPLSVYSLRDISQRLEHERRISYMSRFDKLTGLLNRNAFLEDAQAMIDDPKCGPNFAVFAIDIDRFHEINDVYGHAAGDHVLGMIGARIHESLGKDQLGGRTDGDELVVFSQINTRDQAHDIAETLNACFARDISYEGISVHCSASFGIAMYPSDGRRIEDLLNNADLATYRAKKAEETSFCFYNRDMDNFIRERRQLSDELRKAIDEDQLVLHYQVQMAVQDETVSGFEALVRWQHPERGMIPPGEFIPLAEETGLIVPLGEWVLRTACTEAAAWNNPYNVSVNVSAAQLMHEGFVEQVLSVLMETGLAPARLEFEVTETGFIADHSRAVSVLSRLKGAGISVSIDDFGTGYSSLAMLHEFPFDKIKLDKSLIDKVTHNSKAQGIFKAVLSLGDALEVPVLAEGVETAEQLEYLRAHNCPLAQGYYYGRPGRDTVNTVTPTGEDTASRSPRGNTVSAA